MSWLVSPQHLNRKMNTIDCSSIVFEMGSLGLVWEPKMNLRQSLATAIRTVRKNKGLTQEDFGVVSSRTYLSSLERGLKSPTVDKLEEIAGVLGMHPATILLMAYAIQAPSSERDSLINKIAGEAQNLCANLP